MSNISPFDPTWNVCNVPDYHAVVSIQLCELINDDFFDLSRADWDFGPKYSAAQHAQLCKKITEHYYYREIALVPPGIWKREFLRKMNEIMPKYMPWYELVDKKSKDVGVSYDYITGDGTRVTNGTESKHGNNTVNETNRNDEYYKSRNIFSDFPQTALSGSNQDYASTGNDTEYERIVEGEREETGSTTEALSRDSNENKDYSETRKHVSDPLNLMDNLLLFGNVDASIIDEIEPMFSCMFTVNINGW